MYSRFVNGNRFTTSSSHHNRRRGRLATASTSPPLQNHPAGTRQSSGPNSPTCGNRTGRGSRAPGGTPSQCSPRPRCTGYLTLPSGFELVSFSGEQVSATREHVDPQHLAPNDAMVFYQRIAPARPRR